MRSHIVISLIATLFLGVAIAGAQADSSTADENLTGKIQSLQAELDGQTEEAGELQSSLAAAEEREADALAQIEVLSVRLEKLNAQRPMPSFIGSDRLGASRLAERYGWRIRFRSRYATQPAGTVIDQSPSRGTMMRYRAPIVVTLAKRIPRVPDLVGMNKAAAADAARRGGWKVVLVEQISSAKPGSVIASSALAGARLIPGSTITLTIAKKAPAPPAVDDTADNGGSGCTPGYSPCLPPASDYDCLGGSGDGPKYTGYVKVTGSDPYGLDADNDGVGCES